MNTLVKLTIFYFDELDEDRHYMVYKNCFFNKNK